MREREKQLVRESFLCVREVAGPMSLLFYGRLFALDPALRPLFHGDIARQGMKLMEMVAAVVDNMDQLERLTPALHAMGQRHAAYGVEPRHYETVGEALLWAMGQALEGDFDAEARAAWAGVLVQISATMKEGAALLEAPES